MVEVKSIKKYYGDFLALDNVSFTLGDRGVWGLLGPNGAGKSTLMRIISGYFSCDEGECLVDGHNLKTHLMDAQKKIGYLPDTPPLYNEMTVSEYLTFSAKLKGIPKSEIASEIMRVSKKVDITDRMNKLISSLSKGYRQRVGIAMAILGSPSLIILDEPMVGLDPSQIKEMRTLISDLGKERLVLLSSHILSEVEANCDAIIMLKKGRVELNTQTETLLKNIPQNQTVVLRYLNEDKDLKAFLKKHSQLNAKYLDTSNGEHRISLNSSKLHETLSGLINDGFQVISFTPQTKSLEELFN